MSETSETVTVAQLASRLSDVLERVELARDRVFVTRDGKPVAVVMSVDELELLEDSLDIVSDSATMRELSEARCAVENVDYIDGDELLHRFRNNPHAAT